LKSDGAQYLASALYVNNSLRFLCLSGNELCGLDSLGEQAYDLTGVSALFRALHVNTRLKTLKIAENDIGNDGAKHIADALKENKCLSVLDIHGNALFGVLEKEAILDDERVEKNGNDRQQDSPLQEKEDNGLVIATSVQEAQLDQQQQDDSDHAHGPLESPVEELKYELSGLEGGGSLLTAIGENRYLTSVDLSWNDMGPKGAILFASSLLQNSSLTYLDLHGNYIGDNGVSALCFYLKRPSCKLSVLYIQQVGMTPCGALLVAEVLSINKT
jgi:NLR family CARD domain-containing protein 3